MYLLRTLRNLDMRLNKIKYLGDDNYIVLLLNIKDPVTQIARIPLFNRTPKRAAYNFPTSTILLDIKWISSVSNLTRLIRWHKFSASAVHGNQKVCDILWITFVMSRVNHERTVALIEDSLPENNELLYAFIFYCVLIL